MTAATARFDLVRFSASLTSFILVALTLVLFSRLFLPDNWAGGSSAVMDTLNDPMFWAAVGVGFLAQAIDGALGMAYGVTASTFLLSAGATPAMASASVHIAEVFTTGLSGVAHAKFGNVDRRLFAKLVLPGVAGGVAGAVLVTQLDVAIMKPVISAYLLGMGVYLLMRAYRGVRRATAEPRNVGRLALIGGFVDSSGGGGWGPVVTTTLLGSGQDPRTTVGTVNFAEFWLTLASAASFVILIGTGPWAIVAGLVLGGMVAAPFAALLCRVMRPRVLLAVVGTVIFSLSVFNLVRSLG